ncbi:MAG: UDP-N-acetylmuramate--L-alanine ligase, partial [Planctomycetota bacterium]
MSGLARLLRTRGCVVTGSDLQRTPVTDALAAEGFAVRFEQTATSLPGETQVVVASAAIKPDNPELLSAVERGIPVLTYAEALGVCMADRTGVAVAGTHGKSTTCAMAGHALVQAGLDPTVIVGATCSQLAEGRQGGGAS